MPSRKPSSLVSGRKNPARKNDRRTSNKCTARNYVIVHNGKRWEVERDRRPTGSFADALHIAIRLAIADAKLDAHSGVGASVSLVKKDGTTQQVWP